MLVTCHNCGISFEKGPAQIRKTKNNFCSRICANRFRSDELRYKDGLGSNVSEYIILCAQCGKQFAATAKNRKRKFCSRPCHWEYMKGKPGPKRPGKGLSGERNPNYKNGMNKTTATLIGRRLYGHKCLICGFDIVVNSHHIIPRKEGGKNIPSNLIILCPNHHAMADKGILTREELQNITRVTGLPV